MLGTASKRHLVGAVRYQHCGPATMQMVHFELATLVHLEPHLEHVRAACALAIQTPVLFCDYVVCIFCPNDNPCVIARPTLQQIMKAQSSAQLHAIIGSTAFNHHLSCIQSSSQLTAFNHHLSCIQSSSQLHSIIISSAFNHHLSCIQSSSQLHSIISLIAFNHQLNCIEPLCNERGSIALLSAYLALDARTNTATTRAWHMRQKAIPSNLWDPAQHVGVMMGTQTVPTHQTTTSFTRNSPVLQI
jgi:hypothetical protein